jgi:ectoine hydroxylase-related dioxygenase (phytanoyl-CoA dioxygenase family)
VPGHGHEPGTVTNAARARLAPLLSGTVMGRPANVIAKARRRLRSASRGRGSTGVAAPPPAPSRRPAVLSAAQRAYWETEGFLVLPGFFAGERMDAVSALFDELWARRSTDDLGLVIDAYIDTAQERRIRFKDAPGDARDVPYKLNDLYLVSDLVRELILDRELVKIIDELLDGAPIVCNSLSFERGSQQRFHFDTFYMPPLVENRMLAAWVALEPASEQAGPLRYYPRSHTLPPFHFADGRLKANEEELPAFDAYIEPLLAEHGLEWTAFPAQRGDVFLWHAQLYHGGAPIIDPVLTRRSLVTHYWRACDLDASMVVDAGEGRYYMARPHQAT